MKEIDTLLFPRWIVPIKPSNTYLENQAIAIDKGRILEILPHQEARQRYQAKNNLQFKTHVIMPGLVNAHTHSPMVLFRGMADDLALMDWLQNHIWPAEGKWLSDEFVYDGTLFAILEMLRCGTTCFNDMYFFSESVGRAIDETGMRASISGTVIDFPTAYAKTPNEYFAKAEKLAQTWKNHPLISVTIAPHAPYTVSDESFLKVKQFAEKYGTRIYLHLHETADEVNQGVTQFQKRPIKRMQDLGILSAQTECVHMTQITAEDLQIIQKTGAHVIHCPSSNLKLASGFAPVKQFMDANINVALGTDGAASNNDLDMFNEIHLAAILAKAVAKDPTAVNAAEILRIATLNGAEAMGLEKEIGSIEAGKAADIIAVDMSSINTQPMYNLISNLAYAVNSRQVTDVWVAGKQLLKNGKFIFLDEATILAKAQAWKEKILGTTPAVA